MGSIVAEEGVAFMDKDEDLIHWWRVIDARSRYPRAGCLSIRSLESCIHSIGMISPTITTISVSGHQVCSKPNFGTEARMIWRGQLLAPISTLPYSL